MQLSIRVAQVGDAPAAFRLVEAAYRRYVERIGRPPAPMNQDYASVLREADCWVAETDGRLVGLLVTYPRPDHLFIENVAVAPQAQGSGLGGRLLDVADRHARELGLTQVRLYTNELMTENLDYYPRRGFHETGRATQDGFRRVYFAKTL